MHTETAGRNVMADVENEDTGSDTSAIVADEEVSKKGEPADATKSDDREERDEGPRTSAKAPRRVSLGVRTLAVAGLVLLLIASTATMTWLYFGQHSLMDAQHQKDANYQRAEKLSLDYAVNAATMNYQDMNTWKQKLVAGTTPALNAKLTKAGASMQQILVPLEWTSTAQPLVAKVRSDLNGIYVVDTFVSVQTTTTQAPDNLQSTATYSITIDTNSDWQISDVGGIAAVGAPK